jgi:hypothetical protein
MPICARYCQFRHHSIIQQLLPDCEPGNRIFLSADITCTNDDKNKPHMHQAIIVRSMFCNLKLHVIRILFSFCRNSLLLMEPEVSLLYFGGPLLDTFLIHTTTSYFHRNPCNINLPPVTRSSRRQPSSRFSSHNFV